MEETKLPWIDEEAIASAHPTLFHYTNFINLGSILDSGGLFASPYTETNDREEFLAAKSILCPLIADRAKAYLRTEHPEFIEAVLREGDDPDEIVEKDAAIFYDAGLRTNAFKPHLTCFSAHNETHHKSNGLLSMWRSYCSANNGIALGFDTSRLIRKTEELTSTKKFAAIFLDFAAYGSGDPQLQDRLADSDDVIEMYFKFISNQIRHEKPHLNPRALLKLLVLMTSVKHSDFSDEREIRMIVSEGSNENDNREEVKTFGNKIIVEIADCLTEILIGPTKDPESIEAAVRNTLDHRNFSAVSIRHSGTPFRNL